MDYREYEELCWCPSWSNSLWQGWNYGQVHCPSGNATDPIWRVLASSDGISCWTPLKAQHSNPNPNPLANQLWCIDLLTPPTPLIIPYRLPAFLESLMQLKNWFWLMQDGRKVVWSIPYVSVTFSPSLKHDFIAYRSSKLSDCILNFTGCDNQALVGCIPIDHNLPNPSARAGYDTRSNFKRSLTGLNSEFSFS